MVVNGKQNSYVLPFIVVKVTFHCLGGVCAWGRGRKSCGFWLDWL